MPMHIYSLDLSVTAVKTDKQSAKKSLSTTQAKKIRNVISISKYVQSHKQSGVIVISLQSDKSACVAG